MEQEIAHRQGRWGERTLYRHDTQPGYVVFHGRKAPITRPRLRAKGGQEAGLECDQLFQQDGRMQRCRVHKLRNVIEHLPREKRPQALWCLRGAWAQASATEALKELKACVKWLDEISPPTRRGAWRKRSPCTGSE